VKNVHFFYASLCWCGHVVRADITKSCKGKGIDIRTSKVIKIRIKVVEKIGRKKIEK